MAKSVQIDHDSTFKYILLRSADGTFFVRGVEGLEFHDEIFERVQQTEEDLKDAQAVGGGRICHDSGALQISIYGYSVAFGLADHSITAELIEAAYPEYLVTWSNEGY
ncbi:MAG: hypothetical protein KVP17_004256 [Porospora cf. gigantea B]|uniref:uncharacterized protein n=1 Tax=Porospora cf. gigantea B TaxID=2853592 RepID=UPI003571978E|nr:MAG: hypothetical protein KVP17_004256 [Porospora cf. gigantea B]